MQAKLVKINKHNKTSKNYFCKNINGTYLEDSLKSTCSAKLFLSLYIHVFLTCPCRKLQVITRYFYPSIIIEIFHIPNTWFLKFPDITNLVNLENKIWNKLNPEYLQWSSWTAKVVWVLRCSNRCLTYGRSESILNSIKSVLGKFWKSFFHKFYNLSKHNFH